MMKRIRIGSSRQPPLDSLEEIRGQLWYLTWVGIINPLQVHLVFFADVDTSNICELRLYKEINSLDVLDFCRS